MSEKLIIEASELKNLIEILGLTVANNDDPAYSAVYLATLRTEYGEVGKADILTGLSIQGSVVGSFACECAGQWKSPWLLPAAGRKELVAVLGSWVKEFGEINVVFTVNDGFATVQVEDAAERSLRLVLEDASDWPVDMVAAMIDGSHSKQEVEDSQGNILPAGKRVKIAGSTLAVVSKVAKRLKRDMSFIPVQHPASVVLLECDTWRGAMVAEQYPFEWDVNAPEMEFYDPRDLENEGKPSYASSDTPNEEPTITVEIVST